MMINLLIYKFRRKEKEIGKVKKFLATEIWSQNISTRTETPFGALLLQFTL